MQTSIACDLISLNNYRHLGVLSLPNPKCTNKIRHYDHIENTAKNIKINLIAVFAGEITNNSPSYYCNERQYYYQELTKLNLKANCDRDQNQEVNVTVYSLSFVPKIFIQAINNLTGSEELLVSKFIFENVSNNKIVTKLLEIDTDSNYWLRTSININVRVDREYIVSIETTNPEKIGKYVLVVSNTPD